MIVNCENCNANGQISDEAEQRTLLWTCKSCDVRYLVSSRGMHRAPMPPPPKRKPTGGDTIASPLGLEDDQKPSLRVLTPTPSIAAKASEPDSIRAAAMTKDWIVDMPAEKASGTSPSVLPLLDMRATMYPVIDIPVSDPLWRRPALLASALAGLLVGLAAYGVRWTRDQAATYTPPTATAAVIGQEEVEAASKAENIAEEPRTSQITASETFIAAAPTEAEASPPAKPRKIKAEIVPRRATKHARKSADRAPSEAVAIAPEPPTSLAIEAPAKADPPSLSEAMALAAANEQRDGRGPSETQAKMQPASPGSSGLEGYTPFSRDAALSALSVASVSASRCRSNEGPFGSARIAVTFAPSGQATTAVVEGPPFAGTPVGSCIARAFREARVSPFSGAPVTVRKSVRIF